MGVRDSAGLTRTQMHCVRRGRGRVPYVEANGTKGACKTTSVESTRTGDKQQKARSSSTITQPQRTLFGTKAGMRGGVLLRVTSRSPGPGLSTPYEDGAGYRYIVYVM